MYSKIRTQKLLMQYVIKLYFVYFFIFFCRDLSFALENQEIILRWPSLNIISSVLKINGSFGNDFYTNSILNTPLRSVININEAKSCGMNIWKLGFGDL